MIHVLLRNARVLNGEPSPPPADAVLVRDGVFVAAGPERDLPAARDASVIDCGGGTIVPAFVDAHCHLLAMAARRRSIDCSPAAVRSIADIQARIREATALVAAGTWLRATGYDESQLEERRHPDRRDLDAAAPEHPVRLLHRSGHALVLNTLAMRLAGITTETPEPPGAVIERFPDTGEPSGLLLEMNDVVDAVVPPLRYAELAGAVDATARAYAASGVTAICDATHTNGASEWELFARLQAEGRLPLDVTLMEGLDQAGEMPAEPHGGLRRGHVKITLHELGATLTPGEGELRDTVRRLHASGRDVAIHAVEERAVQAALEAVGAALREHPRPHRHRIEHAALVPDGAPARMAALGVTVVTQPAFIFEHGDRYLRDVPPEKHDRLYPLRELLDAGVRVAASSDAPVGPADPMTGICAAVTRGTRGGARVATAQAISFEQAVAMYTSAAAEACGIDAVRGRIATDMRADFALLDADTCRVREVYRAGERV